jgi:hypothetical protein
VTGERIEVGAERGTDLLVCVRGPLGDRGERPRAGQDRRGSDGEDGDQWMPAPGTPSRVADRGEVAEQVRCLRWSERISVG